LDIRYSFTKSSGTIADGETSGIGGESIVSPISARALGVLESGERLGPWSDSMIGSLRVIQVPVSHLVVTALILLVAVLGVATHRWYIRQRVRWRWAHARDVERRSARLLEDCGYDVLASQVETSYELLVNGKPSDVTLRADYLVIREGRQFVAEVKSGKVAPRIDTAATRRQLLEYLVAFQADGVLLVDGETRQVHEVTFPVSHARPVSLARFWAYVATAVFVAIGLWTLGHGL
jgi:hypothetical protein